MSPLATATRREFLRVGSAAAGGLLVGFYLPDRVRAAAGVAGSVPLNAFIHIGTDDAVTFFIHKAEMGQGTVTSLSMLLAEELECAWTSIRTEFAPVDPAFGRSQGVYGSASIRSSFHTLRQAGATARLMLVGAAAARWGVSPASCRAADGTVIDETSDRRLSYGALAEAAARQPAPRDPVLKDFGSYRLIGTDQPRLDTPAKVMGTATFGIDAAPDAGGQLYAVVARCPVFGGTLERFDDAGARRVPGVRHVVAISNGVAVVADNTWAAMQGRKALDVTWHEGRRANTSSTGLRTMFADLARRPGEEARREGDAAAALAGAAKVIEATYEVPYLAHAPMEPLNCTAHVTADRCDIWAATQGQTAAQQAGTRITGLPASQVFVHTLYMGGGFGRRAGSDYVGEAVEISKAIGARVKLTWSREDDTQHDTYRPASLVAFRGAVDAAGWPLAVQARVACPSFRGPRPGVDRTAVEGLADMAYALPHLLVEYHNPDAGIPTSYWRSVGYSQNTFFTESFLDELAALGGKDPLEVRRRLLAGQPRMRRVVELAAEQAGWGTPLPAGRGRGLSVNDNIGSFTAQVAEVSVERGRVRVHRVVCAVDCGTVINPAIVRQQIESGIAYGLSAALKGAITIDRGRVEQTSFGNYDVVRIDEMPAVDVHIVPNREDPGGIGEASTPGIAPAVANALFAATGRRVRRLPVRAEDLAG